MTDNNEQYPFPRVNIFVLRHGEIATGDTRRFVGQRDLPLTETGIEQARLWQQELAPIRFNRIFTSDLPRCLETTAIVAETQEARIEEVPAFREINLGEWQGIEVDEIRRLYPDQFEQRGRNIANFRPPGGESFSDLYDRVAPVFEDITQGLEGAALIVCHSGVIKVMLCRALDLDVSNVLKLEQTYSALNVIERAGPYFRLYAMNIPPAAGIIPLKYWPNSKM